MHNQMTLLYKFSCTLALVAFATLALPAHAQDQKVIVTINDRPITSYDVKQRINLWKLLGDKRAKAASRKASLDELIDDIAAVEETKKLGFPPQPKEVDDYVAQYSKGLKTDEKGLQGKLKSQGISMAAMRQYLEGRVAFNRLVRGKFKEDFSVSDAEVQKRVNQFKREIDGNINQQIAKIEADPRRKPITVYELMPIQFPVDAPKDQITRELINSRAIEASTFISRFKGCKSARSAASGIFNVKIGKRIEADASKMNPKLRQALSKVGAGKALGPIPTATGAEAIAFCGSRTITPPKVARPKNIQYPTTDQVKNMLAQEKFDKVASKYSGRFRKGLLIEYRDPSFNQ
jgi:peptidyl-prolyl cis-trans isomerase SurA